MLASYLARAVYYWALIVCSVKICRWTTGPWSEGSLIWGERSMGEEWVHENGDRKNQLVLWRCWSACFSDKALHLHQSLQPVLFSQCTVFLKIFYVCEISVLGGGAGGAVCVRVYTWLVWLWTLTWAIQCVQWEIWVLTAAETGCWTDQASVESWWRNPCVSVHVYVAIANSDHRQGQELSCKRWYLGYYLHVITSVGSFTADGQTNTSFKTVQVNGVKWGVWKFLGLLTSSVGRPVSNLQFSFYFFPSSLPPFFFVFLFPS